MAPTTPSTLPEEAPDKEALVKRNPHADFSAVEASRPDYDDNRAAWSYSKTPNASWRPGDGANDDAWKSKSRVSIDPYEPGRDLVLNYKLMISSTVPRPIALVSTVTSVPSPSSPSSSSDNTAAAEAGGAAAETKTTKITRNLSPFSYFQCLTTDPPLYTLSFTGRAPNDTLRNLLATRQCCISTVSDAFVEAANFSSVNTPPHISEWELCGLTPRDADLVAAPYVAESPVSMECRYYSHQDIYSRVDPGVRTATMVVVEVVRWHVWDEALGRDRGTVDPAVLRPVWRAGGITYGIAREAWEVPRPEAFRVLRREDERVRAIVGEDGAGVK